MKKNYGQFIAKTAGYEINTLNLPTSWEYIYENKEVLLKVDQNGPIYAQANPPGDIMIFKRENHQKYSPWHIRFYSDSFSGAFTNFFRPNTYEVSLEPENLKIKYLPEMAVYSFEFKNIRVRTELFVPNSGTNIVCKTYVKNLGDKTLKLKVAPQYVPYSNDAQMAPWDKYEWYIDTTCTAKERLEFQTDMLSATGNKKKRRATYFSIQADGLKNYELSLEKYIGNGDIFNPQRNYTNEERIYGYPPVYAAEYNWELESGEERVITQVLNVGYAINNEPYNDDEYYKVKVIERKSTFDKLFSKNTIKTSDAQFDNYVNYWLPLQMNWVASLDRGWPTGMRGSRDSAQDYTALLYSDVNSCKNIILNMLECQRTDGWFPRQYCAKGRHGKHDLRNYVDAGAFFAEFLWKYLAHTKDFDFLSQEVCWLDSDKMDTVFDHFKAGVDYYINKENIGEHGLCKIREGDWLDSVHSAGLEGRGESVTVSAQTVMSMYYIADVIKKLDLGIDYTIYLDYAKKISDSINKYAYNQKGYYNGVFNDDGKWIFSDNDPDGKERIYGVSSYYSVISGVADGEKCKTVLENIDRLKSDKGYRLFYPYLGDVPIDKVGRVASGDVPPYLVENGNVYNHGSQGFFARALSVMGESHKLAEVIRWLLPYDTTKHPTEKTYTPPYAIVNCYQQLPGFDHRGLMCFLTGSVAMGVRGVYEWMFGIQPCLDGLEISPCLTETEKNAQIEFELLGEKHTLKYVSDEEVYLDGFVLTEKRKNMITGKTVWFVKK